MVTGKTVISLDGGAGASMAALMKLWQGSADPGQKQAAGESQYPFPAELRGENHPS